MRLTGPTALLDGLDGSDVYFPHSFACAPAEPVAVAEADHESPIVAAVERGAVAGVQFHPERSSAAGARVLRNALKGVRFEGLREVYVTVSVEGRRPLRALVERAAAELKIPFTVGDGVAGLEDALVAVEGVRVSV